MGIKQIAGYILKAFLLWLMSTFALGNWYGDPGPDKASAVLLFVGMICLMNAWWPTTPTNKEEE